MREKIYSVIKSPDGESTRNSCYDYFMMAMILVSLLPLTVKENNSYLQLIENVSIAVFSIDYILRWIVADYEYPNLKNPFKQYVYQPMAIIDLLSILPAVLVLVSVISPKFMSMLIFRLARLARVARALKFLKYSRSCKILYAVVKESVEPLRAVVGLAVIYIVVAAILMFNVEPRFKNFFEALYWATISLTTVGYGDFFPKTNIGRAIAMISSLVGVAIIALPSGIITAGYMKAIDKIDDENIKQ